MSHDDGKRGYQDDLNSRRSAKGEIPQAPETSRTKAERNAEGNSFKAKLRQAGREHLQKLKEKSIERKR